MRSEKDLKVMTGDGLRKYCAWFRGNVDKLNGLYAAMVSEDGTPEQTVNALADEIGKNAVKQVVATIVNYYDGQDGRIAGYVNKWARDMVMAWDYKAGQLMRISVGKIHPAHLDQIAKAAMNL